MKTQVKQVAGHQASSAFYEALHRVGLLPPNCTRFVITSEVAKCIRIEADYFADDSIEEVAEEAAKALATGGTS